MKHFVLASMLILPVWGQASAEPLQAKPGLWETTTVTEIKRAKAPTNLDQLSLEQRAKVEDKLAQQVKRETRVAKSCLKQEQIDSGEAFTGGGHHGACTRAFETQTRIEQEAWVDCKGANPMTGMVRMQAADTEHITGTIEMTYGPANGLQMLSASQITARWLTGACDRP